MSYSFPAVNIPSSPLSRSPITATISLICLLDPSLTATLPLPSFPLHSVPSIHIQFPHSPPPPLRAPASAKAQTVPAVVRYFALAGSQPAGFVGFITNLPKSPQSPHAGTQECNVVPGRSSTRPLNLHTYPRPASSRRPRRPWRRGPARPASGRRRTCCSSAPAGGSRGGATSRTTRTLFRRPNLRERSGCDAD